MPQLYDSPELETLHRKAIQALAIETGEDLEVVKQVYEAELARLQIAAQVTEYLVLLSARRARETLRKPAKPARSQPVTA